MKEIGIDIDGCLNHYHEILRNYIKEHYGFDVSSKEYCVLSTLNFSSQEIADFWKKFEDISINLEIEKDSKIVIDKLSQLFTINIITARTYNSAISTEMWLKKNSIHYNNIYFNCENKLNTCKWKNVDVMIEDSSENALVLAKNSIKVILFDRTYNREIKHENIIRCKSWNEIWSVISLMDLNGG